MAQMDQAQTNYGAAKRFRLVLREQGSIREMGGEDMSIAVGITDSIFMNALDTGTSDIHLQPERDQLKIRYRQDGVLQDTGQLPMEQATNVIARLKLAAGMRIDENREPSGRTYRHGVLRGAASALAPRVSRASTVRSSSCVFSTRPLAG